MAKVRREQLRWLLLLAMNHGRPSTVAEALLLGAAREIHPDVTALELRRELDYLADRKLVQVHKAPSGPWCAELTRYGVDVVEYTIGCEPGIARPDKYW